MADPGAERFPLVCAPHVVLVTGRQGTLACLKVLPAGWPGVQEPGRTCRGSQTKSQAPGASPQSPVRLLQHVSHVLGVKGRSSMEWSPLFASGAAGQAEGRLLVEVAGHAG